MFLGGIVVEMFLSICFVIFVVAATIILISAAVWIIALVGSTVYEMISDYIRWR